MAEGESLEIWTVATFTVVIFGLIGVRSGHLIGVLSDVMSGHGGHDVEVERDRSKINDQALRIEEKESGN